MKKLTLYLIIFLAVFVGTATCVVVNGYSKYTEHNQNEVQVVSEQENNALTSLASNVLSLDSFGGKFTLTDNNSTNIVGNFTLENSCDLAVCLNLKGTSGNLVFDAHVTYLNESIFLEINGIKAKLSSTDIETTINCLLNHIESSSGEQLPELDTSALTNILGEIKTIETDTGAQLSTSLPNICDLFVQTDKDYIPTQILATNIAVADHPFTLNIKCNSGFGINEINEDEYYSLSPLVNHLEPTLNMLSEENLGITAEINLAGNKILVKSQFSKNNGLSGNVEFGNLKMDFQVKNDYILIDAYGKVFKISSADLLEALGGLALAPAIDTNLEDFFTYFKIVPTVNDNYLTALDLTYDQISAHLEFGKTYFKPITIKEDNTKSIKDLKNLLTSYTGLISNTYSLDLNFVQDNISISGKAFIAQGNLNLEKIYFSGKIVGVDCSIIFENGTAYCDLDGNKFKISASSVEKVLEIILTSASSSTQDSLSTLDITYLSELTFLEDIDFEGNTIILKTDNLEAKITAYSGFYRAKVSLPTASFSATIHTDNTYSYISKNFDASKYADFNNVPNLVSAITKTFNQNYLHFNGNLSFDLFEHNIKNIGLDLKIYKNEKKMVVTLDNLPVNPVLTYLNLTHYKNQTCKITISENTVNIYTTVTHNLTNKVYILANKTLAISEFSLDNLYEIMSLRKSIINEIKESTTSDSNFIDKLSLDLIKIFEEKTVIDLTSLVENFADNLSLEFNYSDLINSLNAKFSVKNAFFVYINLKRI